MSRIVHIQRRAFSLIELVIVVVIIGIIAAIAIPRMSRGAEGAAEAAIDGNLAVLRNALDLYATEHGGAFPALLTFEAQMTQYTDYAGSAQATKDATHIYGPYLRDVPTMPLGAHKDDAGVAAPGATPPVAEVAGANGWLYSAGTGEIWANATGYFDR
jgi:prepilin-type N-terminal cleavage/methylation domain-containing protein